MALEVRLIAHTTDPVRVVAVAAKLCYSDLTVAELLNEPGLADAGRLLEALRESGHMSPFEHASFTFAVEGLSRVASHQLVRHRIASYSQRSQRYAPMSAGCVVPPKIERDPEARAAFSESLRAARAAYERMTGLGIPKEDARFILPHGCETSVIVTMNARELLHFFELRLCRRAQWEIRSAARLMLAGVYGAARELFAAAGPPCVTGACRERKSCGMPYKDTEKVLEES